MILLNRNFVKVSTMFSTPGSVQGEVRWSSEQPGLEEGAPIHGWMLDLEDLKGLSQHKPFYDPMLHTWNAM